MARTPKKQNGKKRLKAIFIHSLYRTGSTYVWSKFRQNNKFRCYYDPFHHSMGSIDAGNPLLENLLITDAHRLRHPVLEKEYTDEYIKLLGPGEKGVPFFKKSFTADDYCNNGDNPEQKKYIDFLIRGAEKQIPVFKFNLSPLRIVWFKKNYPDALHLYLLRDPRNQFQSYLEMYGQKFEIFLVNDLIISGVNRNSPFFEPLGSQVPLFQYHCEHFQDEYYIYRRLVPLYSDYEKYYIFYYIWFTALMENVLNSDIILNIDYIDTSASYRAAVGEELKNRGASGIDFDDAASWDYKKYALKKSQLLQVEKTVQALVLRRYSNKKFELFAARLEAHNKNRFDLQDDMISFLRQRPLEPVDFLRSLQEKHDRLVEILANDLLELKRTTRQPVQNEKENPYLSAKMKQELVQTRKELGEKIQLLQEKDRQIQKRDQLLLNKNQEIGALEQQWKKDHETFSKEIKEKEELLERFRSRTEIKDLAMKLHETEQSLEQKEWELKNTELRWENRMAIHESNLEQKDELIKEKDQLIADMKQQLAKNSEELTETKRQLNQDQHQLVQKTQALEKAENLLGWKDQILKKKDGRIAALVKEKNIHMIQIEGKNKRIDELTQELNWASSHKFVSSIRKIFKSSK